MNAPGSFEAQLHNRKPSATYSKCLLFPCWYLGHRIKTDFSRFWLYLFLKILLPFLSIADLNVFLLRSDLYGCFKPWKAKLHLNCVRPRLKLIKLLRFSKHFHNRIKVKGQSPHFQKIKPSWLLVKYSIYALTFFLFILNLPCLKLCYLKLSGFFLKKKVSLTFSFYWRVVVIHAFSSGIYFNISLVILSKTS